LFSLENKVIFWQQASEILNIQLFYFGRTFNNRNLLLLINGITDWFHSSSTANVIFVVFSTFILAFCLDSFKILN